MRLSTSKDVIGFRRDMGEKIASPSVGNGGAVRYNKDTPGIDFPSKFIGSESFTETGFRIPEKLTWRRLSRRDVDGKGLGLGGFDG